MNQEVTTEKNVDNLLSELEQLLCNERQALLSFSAESIDEVNEKKALLQRELVACRHLLSVAHRERLQDLKRHLRHNLILLVHARNHIHGLLGLEPGSLVFRPSAKPTAGGIRLDMRG
jgi:hypothetical protein